MFSLESFYFIPGPTRDFLARLRRHHVYFFLGGDVEQTTCIETECTQCISFVTVGN